MRDEAVHIVLALLTLVVGGAAEMLLPKPCGVGFPVLMAAAVYFAVRRGLVPAMAFAVAAGAMEDALSGLPAATSASWFLAVAALARWSEFPHGALSLAYPAYQVWLWAWMASLGGGVFARVLVALPMGLAAAVVTWSALAWADGKAAVDEA